MQAPRNSKRGKGLYQVSYTKGPLPLHLIGRQTRAQKGQAVHLRASPGWFFFFFKLSKPVSVFAAKSLRERMRVSRKSGAVWAQ